MKEKALNKIFFWKNKLQNSTDWYWSNCTRIYFMSGGGSDPNVYSDAIFNFRRIRLAQQPF
jgi:hypothetical protein